jgi:two-component system response regulator AlgR
LERAIGRALVRRDSAKADGTLWLSEFWVPNRSELLRIDADEVSRIDAERDYVRLHVGGGSYLLLQTIAGLEAKLDPDKFIRIHRSTILRKDMIRGLRHEGLGVWSVEMEDGEDLRIGRTYLRKVKAMAGR